MLKLVAAVVFLTAVPLAAGAWLLGTPDQMEGMITIMMGVVLAVFMLGVIFSSPGAGGGRSGPAPD